jgi:hypothetical protein
MAKSNLQTLLGVDISNSIAQIKDDIQNKILPKLKALKIPVTLEVSQLQSLANVESAIKKIVAESKKIGTGTTSGTTGQADSLKDMEAKERQLADVRIQLLKEVSAIQQQVTQIRLDTIEREAKALQEKDRIAAERAESSAKRQAELFEKNYGTIQDYTLPFADGGTGDITDAIKGIEGFADANVKAIGSAQFGEQIFDRYIATVKNAGGGFDTYELSVDNATGATYLLEQGLKSVDGAFVRSSQSANDAISSMADAFVAMGVLNTLEQVKEILWDCVLASTEFESALAGVRKTTNFTVEEVSELREQFLQLSTIIPTSAADLAGIAEIAGQLGVAKNNISDFTRIMADLGVSTNLAGQDAAMMFSRFANITQMPQQNFENLGSAIVKLGNETATTESEIGEMALRLASSGQQAGMSEASILGLAAGLS